MTGRTVVLLAHGSADPRHAAEAVDTARLQPSAVAPAAEWWGRKLGSLEEAGAGAFRLTGLPGLPPSFIRSMTEARRGNAALLAWTPGLDWSRYVDLPEYRRAACEAMIEGRNAFAGGAQ